MSAIPPPPPGIYTPIPTFFKKDLVTIDFDSQIKHAEFLIKSGITGLVVMRSTGENAQLTREERFSIISQIHNRLPDFTLIGGIAQNSVEDALAEIESVKKAGAKYAVVLPSNYFGASIKQDFIFDWYTEVANKSSLPILIYVYPGVSNNVYIDPETIKKLSYNPNIVGTKISHGDVSQHTLIGLDKVISNNDFKCFTGLGQILLPALVVGFQGTIDALSGATPKIYIEILNLYNKGELEKAAQLQLIVTRGEELVVRLGVFGIKKAILTATGIGETHLGRAPLNQDISETDWNQYSAHLSELINIEMTL